MPGLRVDRLVTMGVFNPLRQLRVGTGAPRVPVLMYHSISDSEETVPAYYRTCTSLRVFAAHLELLKTEGWRVVGLEQARALLASEKDLGKVAAITFDDGFRDFYTAAFPLLRQHGFGATMYLPTAFIDREPRRFKDRECMTWNEVRECHSSGIEFGSHTVNHPKLYELEFSEIRKELEISKATIEEQLGQRVTAFAYPYAFPSADRRFVEAFVDLLKTLGYQSNATTRIGRIGAQDDSFTLRRLPANAKDDPGFFRAKLLGAYDWMNWPQDTLKKIKTVTANQRGAAQPRPCPGALKI